MAILQVSRITQRKGLEQDLPQPLAGAELGWAIDQRRLYIGNGSLAEGAPVVGNTEILTEFSDILSYANQYTYKGEAGGYVVQTGPTAGDPVVQSLQSRLDNYAIVKDFGAKGDGITDDTAAINRALQQLFCINNNPSTRRSLFFPAGRYIVTDTILIPPNACLYGEGADSSIIDLDIQEWDQLVSYAAGVTVVITSAGPSFAFYRSNFPVPAGTAIGALAPNGDPYWDSSVTEPDYIARTADSLQQTGANIQTNGASAPGYVEISNMSFQTNRVIDGFLFEQANQCSTQNVTVRGPLTTLELTSANDDTAAIRFISTVSNTCSQIVVDSGGMSGFTWGVETDQLTKGITISNNFFDTLYQGVRLDTQPTGVRIMHNTFDRIYAQGIEFLNCSLNATGYNVFYDVGNNFNGLSLPASSIILINADNNLSVGDMFARSDAQSIQHPRIELYDSNTSMVPATIAVTNGLQIELGTYTRQSGIDFDIEAGEVNTTIFQITVGDRTSNPIGVRALQMDYTIVRGTAVRTGTMTITSIPDDSTGEFAWVDDFVENSSTGVTLTPTDSPSTPPHPGGTITLQYSSTLNDPSGVGKMYYSLTYLG